MNPRVCVNPECGVTIPAGKMRRRGLCTRCYQAVRYADPVIRARLRANDKHRKANLSDEAAAKIIQRIDAWQKANPEKVKSYKKKNRERYKAEHGVGHTARWAPGRRVSWVVGGKRYYGVCTGKATRAGRPGGGKNRYEVAVKVDLTGEVVLFATSELTRHDGCNLE